MRSEASDSEQRAEFCVHRLESGCSRINSIDSCEDWKKLKSLDVMFSYYRTVVSKFQCDSSACVIKWIGDFLTKSRSDDFI